MENIENTVPNSNAEGENNNANQQQTQTNSAQHQPEIPIQKALPNSTAVLVLGILSIVFCWCYGLVGITLGVIALILASKDLQLYNAYPNTYSEVSLKNLRAGKICSIIGLSLSGLYLIIVVAYFIIYGTLVFSILESANQIY